MLHFCEMIVLRENKKRIMPRHIMTAAALSGIIPYDLIKNQPELTKEDLETIKKSLP
jgi:uncharacterized protein (DUF433 family)